MAKKDIAKPIALDPRGGRPRDKCVTHIEGIDRILNGGVPIGNIVLLAGTVGSGKTTLAMEFLINGAKAGETCCYISVTEPSSKMLSNLQTYGFFDEALVKEGKLNIFDLTGRQVASLVNKTMIPGTHQISWNPGQVSSGVYLVKLIVGNTSLNQKITYVK